MSATPASDLLEETRIAQPNGSESKETCEDGEAGGVEDGVEGRSACETYRIRWAILVLFVMYSMSNAFQWIQFSIIGDIVQAYYNISPEWVDMTSMVYMICYIPLIFPATFLLEKKVRLFMLSSRRNERAMKETSVIFVSGSSFLCDFGFAGHVRRIVDQSTQHAAGQLRVEFCRADCRGGVADLRARNPAPPRLSLVPSHAGLHSHLHRSLR